MAGWGADDELIDDGASSATPAGAWGADDQLIDEPRQARRGTARAGAAPYVPTDETMGQDVGRSTLPMGAPDPRRVDQSEGRSARPMGKGDPRLLIGDVDRTWAEAGGDTALSAVKGVVGFGESLVGLADIFTGNKAGDLLASAGYDPKTTKAMLSGWQSDKRKLAEARVQAADGFTATATALLQNPDAIGGAVVESLPQMLGPAAVGRQLALRAYAAGGPAAVQAALGKISTRVSAMEGAQSAGSIQEQARQEGRTYGQSVLPAVAGGAATALIGRAANAIPGLQDAAVLAATRGLTPAVGGVAARGAAAARGALTEGPIEELPQSAGEQIAQNLALGKPWDDGVGSAAAQGLVVGGVTGGVFGALHGAGPNAARETVAAIDNLAARPISEQDAATAFAAGAGAAPGFVDPRATARTVGTPDVAGAAPAPAAPAPIRVEDMPETVDPDAIGRMQAQAAGQRAVFEAAQEATKQAPGTPDQGAAPVDAPGAVFAAAKGLDITSLAQGSQAARAEAQLRQNAAAVPQPQPRNAGPDSQTEPGRLDTPGQAQTAAGQVEGAVAAAAAPDIAAAPAAETTPAQAETTPPPPRAARPAVRGTAMAERVRAEVAARFAQQRTQMRQSGRGGAAAAASIPSVSAPMAGEALDGFNRVADAFERALGHRPIAYSHVGKGSAYGFFDPQSGAIFVNVAQSNSVAATAFHEFAHRVRSDADRGDAASAKAVAHLDDIYDSLIPDDYKRRYAGTYLFRTQNGPVDEAGIDAILADPKRSATLRDEVTADFMGQRGSDEAFWQQLAAKRPDTFGEFARNWIDTLSRLIEQLRTAFKPGSIKNVDAAIESKSVQHLVRAKRAAERVLEQWASNAREDDAAATRSAEPGLDRAPADAGDALASSRPADDAAPRGVTAEVAPDPRRDEVIGRWRALDPGQRLRATQEVFNGVWPKIAALLGYPSDITQVFGSGTFEGEVNPNINIEMPGATFEEIDELSRIVGYVLTQKAMVAFDERDTAGGSQAGFVKVIPPSTMSSDEVDELRREIARAVPQATGDTVRDGAIVYGNFSAYTNAKVTDEEFFDAIRRAVDVRPENIEVTEPVRFRSEYIEPDQLDGYLEGTRYGRSGQENQGGRDVLRGWAGADPRRLDAARQWASTKLDDIFAAAERGRYEGVAPQPRRGAGADTRGSAVPGGFGAGAPALSYGRPRDGAIAVDAFHLSQERRSVLTSSAFGTGLRGSARDAFKNAKDTRLAERVYFYVNRGGGINPESGVGGQVHRVRLTNIYDADADPLGLRRGQPMSLTAQSAILDAGFDGFLVRGANLSGMAILLGRHDVPVEYVGQKGGRFDAGEPAPPFAGNIWYSRRDDELGAFNLDRNDKEFDEYEGFDTMVEDEFVGEAKKKGDDEEADLRDEQDSLQDELLAEQQALRSASRSPRATVYAMPDSATLKAVGIMAEAAFPALKWAPNANGNPAAEVRFAGAAAREGTIELRAPSREEGYGGGFNAVPDSPRSDPPGAALGLRVGARKRGLTERFARAYNQAVAASVVLHAEGFDLAAAVPPAARKRVIAAWQRIGTLPGAFELGRPSFTAGAPSKQKAQEIAASVAGPSRPVEVEVTQAGSYFSFTMPDPKGAQEFSVEFSGGAGRRGLVIHTDGLTSNSGAGKTAYQIAFAFASAVGLPVNADPQGLTGINTYRRTEQMLAAAVRNGEPTPGKIGFGQRVYGWQPAASTASQHGANLSRLALAAARNAVEVAPQARDLTYDLAADRFDWRPKTRHPQTAEQFVAATLAEPDARGVGLSRSTLARAALTWQAVDGPLDIDPATEVASPVLYSSREEGVEDDVYTQAVERQAVDYKAAAAHRVEFEARVAETGSVVAVEIDAAEAMRDIEERIEAMLELRKCLGRP